MLGPLVFVQSRIVSTATITVSSTRPERLCTSGCIQLASRHKTRPYSHCERLRTMSPNRKTTYKPLTPNRFMYDPHKKKQIKTGLRRHKFSRSHDEGVYLTLHLKTTGYRLFFFPRARTYCCSSQTFRFWFYHGRVILLQVFISNTELNL